jgi:hypothetical protein
MTSHELARKFLDGPDVPVLIQASEDGELRSPVRDPEFGKAQPVLKPGVGFWDAGLWWVFPNLKGVNPPGDSVLVILLNPKERA